MNLTDAIQIAHRGFDAWASKPHNKQWLSRIEGTPIPNDLVVCIAAEIVAALSPDPLTPAAGRAGKAEEGE